MGGMEEAEDVWRGRYRREAAHTVLHCPLPLLSLAQPRPLLPTCLQSQLGSACFPPALYHVPCCRCVFQLLLGVAECWWDLGGGRAPSWHNGRSLTAVIPSHFGAEPNVGWAGQPVWVSILKHQTFATRGGFIKNTKASNMPAANIVPDALLRMEDSPVPPVFSPC